jgi:predicted MPP superfamily phosphohydrolase
LFTPYVRDYLMATVYVHFLMMVWPHLRPWPWRVFINYPASFFSAGTLLCWPWAIATAFGASPYWLLVPYGFALLGVAESLYTRETVRDLVLDGLDAGALRRYPLGKPNGKPVLQIVQITDPHIGPFMSIKRLRRICERAVARNPDLILLTGDFLTIESNRVSGALETALAPLSAAKGKVFACFGNHDHEAPHHVERALSAAGVRLLVDEATEVDTPIGRVQLLGFDFHFKERERFMNDVCARFPRPEGMLRIVLLHDPGAFKRLPDGEGDLVLSGHTHGGQVGLVSFGLPWTFVSAVTSMPDHGLWARGRDRLYVHRGTGHYGFPLRVGVPAEQSLLRIQRT